MQKWPCAVVKSQQGSEGLWCWWESNVLQFACWESSHGGTDKIQTVTRA